MGDKAYVAVYERDAGFSAWNVAVKGLTGSRVPLRWVIRASVRSCS